MFQLTFELKIVKIKNDRQNRIKKTSFTKAKNIKGLTRTFSERGRNYILEFEKTFRTNSNFGHIEADLGQAA